MATPNPSQTSTSTGNKALLSALGILKTETYDQLVSKYPKLLQYNYIVKRESQGDLKHTSTKDFYHYEEGKSLPYIKIVTGATGTGTAAITVTIDPESIADSKHPAAIGDYWFDEADGKVYEVTAKPAANTITVKNTDAAAAAVIADGAYLTYRGNVNAGEASSAKEGMYSREEKVTGEVRTIRSDIKFTDEAMITRDDVPDTHYYTIREMVREYERFMAKQEMDLMLGKSVDNGSVSSSAKGLLQQVIAKGQTKTDSTAIDADFWDDLKRLIDAEGGSNEYDMLADTEIEIKFGAFLRSTYNNGAVQYLDKAFEGQGAINADFQSYKINGIKYNVTGYAYFNAPKIFGVPQNIGYYKDQALLIPRGEGVDAKSGQSVPRFSVRYWTKSAGDPIIAKREWGNFTATPTGVEEANYEHITRKGLQLFGANAFIHVAL